MIVTKEVKKMLINILVYLTLATLLFTINDLHKLKKEKEKLQEKVIQLEENMEELNKH